ncbi:MAG: glycosyltransferase [Pseudomonadota bacterium]
MRVLAITYSTRVPDNSRLYESLGQNVDLQHMQIDRTQALQLDRTLAAIDLLAFDRVVIELRAKHVMRHWRTLWQIPNLVLFEEDTWQNYASFGKNRNYFTKYFKAAQPSRILHSGFTVARKTRELGYDSCFLPKGFDGGRLRNIGLERDIELGFVGRVKHKNYVPRKKFLEHMHSTAGLQLLRTYSHDEYLNTLNRIRFFISADIEFGEHMIKNFEAMACGCVLFAYRQGEDDQALGLVDMETAVLFSDYDELNSKIAQLRDNPALADSIAAKGQQLAETNHDLWDLGTCYYRLLARPLLPPSEPRLKRWRHAAIKQPGESLQQYQQQPVYAHTTDRNLFTHSDYNLRTFPQTPFWQTDELGRYLKNYLHLLKLSVPVPRVSCWGELPGQKQTWLLHDACALTPPADAEAHADGAAIRANILALIQQLHAAGMWLNSFKQDDLGWDAQGQPVWLNAANLTWYNQPLGPQRQRENMEQLLANAGQDDHPQLLALQEALS